MPAQRIWIAYTTLVRKELVRNFRIWTQTFLPPVITMSLYFIIFGAFIGSQIDPIGGYSYMQFIVPGLVMMAVLTNAYSNVATSFFSAKFMHSLEEIIVSPIPNWVVIAGFVTGGVARGLIVGVLVLATSLFFAKLALFSAFIVVASVVMTSVLFSLAGLLNGLFSKGFDSIAIVPTFILTPLTYLGGIFYSVDMLPQFWQNVSLFNPILYMVNAFRYGFLGISDVPLLYCFGILIGFTLVFLVISLWLFHKGIGMKN